MGYIGNGPYQGVLTGGNIQDGTVETTDLADGAVTTVKIADASVTATKLAAGAAVPSQSGQSGKYLTTDGSTASWDAPFEGGVVINESGADVDFRIESDTNANAFFLDGATGNVGISTSSPQYTTQITSTSANAVTNILALHNGSNAAGTGTGARLLFKLANFENAIESRKYASIEGISTSSYNESIDLVFKTQPHASSGDVQERMRIDSAGRVTMPYQPAFSVSGSSFSGADFIGTSVLTNVGSHFSTSTGRFTAPVSGRYLFAFTFTPDDGSSNFVNLFINGSQAGENILNYGSQWQAASNIQILNLSAGDYVNARRRSTSGYPAYSALFCGHLIG